MPNHARPLADQQQALPRLFGREREQALLRQRIDDTLAGSGSLALISGGAGIGKTSLAGDAATAAREQAALVLGGSCYDLTATPPYGPWIEILNTAREHPYVEVDPSPLLSLLQTDGDSAGLPHAQTLFDGVFGFVREIAGQRPLVLILEDLHWSDPASLDLLRSLARRVSGQRVLILVTYRGDEIDDQHYLFQLLPALVREARALQIELRGLEYEDLRQLVGNRYAFPEESEARLARRLYGSSEGNPFFAEEILRTLEEERILYQVDGRWELGPLDVTRVPSLVRQVIERRLARIARTARRQLAVAAVIGEEFPIEQWAGISGTPNDALRQTIQAALGARILKDTADGPRLQFMHALTRDVLYERLLPHDRSRYHREIAEQLAAESHPDPDTVAHHFQRAGDSRAIPWLIRAADRARRAAARMTAADRLETALNLMARHETDPDDEAIVRAELAWMRAYVEPQNSLDHLNHAIQLAATTRDRHLEAVLLDLRGEIHCQMGHWRVGLAEMEQSQRIIQQFEAADPDDDHHRIAIRWNLEDILAPGPYLTGLGFVGRYQEAVDVAAELLPDLRLIDVPDDTRAGPLAIAGLALALAGFGSPEEAQRGTTLTRHAARAAQDWVLAGASANWELCYVTIPYFTDRPVERNQIAREGEQAMIIADGAQGGWPPQYAYLEIDFLEGRWDRIDRLAGMIDPRSLLVLAWHLFMTVRGEMYRARGDVDSAWQCVWEVLPHGPATEPGNSVFHLATKLQRLAAALALDAGDLDRARAWLRAHDRWLEWNGAVQGRADGMVLWARYHLLAGAPDRARTAACQALEQANSPRQPLALLRAHRMLGMIETEHGGHHQAAKHFSQALEIARASAAHYEIALTRLALARLQIETGEVDGVRDLLNEVRAFCKTLGATRALDRASQFASMLGNEFRAGLTARETEVLGHVADGLTNAEVAAQLAISPRTVDHHLRSIYSKLDVPSRAAAIRIAVERGII